MQAEIARALGVEPSIDPATEVERRVQFLADYLLKSGARGYVLGISGGQDSTLAGRLAQLACERVRAAGREAVFVAVGLPYKVQKDADDAANAMAFIQPDKQFTVNIESGVSAIENSLSEVFPGGLTDFNRGNVKARIRMVEQYAIAGELGLLVIGTDHAAEAVTGFYTKFGDGAADITPLAGLTKRQGSSLLVALGAPKSLYEKVPTADLLDGTPGRADEDELGLTYEQIDDYLEGKPVAAGVTELIEGKYKASAHKRALPVTPY
ncbi:MAG: ammonia-dependent NAD(+) synthetase [Cellulomonadaceae bacterium]|jgi:NAD+ synthase|nr:ammonia-dependent NAD(+) synthetase [Cellulomonadaceae bacterium]